MAITITSIPKPYRTGLANIKRLPSEIFDQILSALEMAPLAGSWKQLASSVIKQVPSLKREEIEEILKSVFSLGVFMTDEDTPLTENLSNLSRAMTATGRPELSLSDEEKGPFEDRLQRLLSATSVALSSKVQRLKLEYPVTFHNALIVSDMRPVFEKAEARPSGCTISHTLRIGYHENNEHKEFFVVMDDEDLETLRKLVDRAKAKSSTIKSLLKLANISDLS